MKQYYSTHPTHSYSLPIADIANIYKIPNKVNELDPVMFKKQQALNVVTDTLSGICQNTQNALNACKATYTAATIAAQNQFSKDKNLSNYNKALDDANNSWTTCTNSVQDSCFSQFENAATGADPSIIQTVESMVLSALNSIGDFFASLWNTVSDWLTSLWNEIVSEAGTILADIESFFDGLGDDIDDGLNAIIDWL